MAAPKPGEIAEAVRTAIKRNGTFDAVRKRAVMDVSHADGFLDDVRIEGKAYCDSMFQSIFGDSLDIEMSKSLKDFMMAKIKEHASRKEIANRVRWTIEHEITFEWVQRALQEKVEEMVRAQLGLPPLPKPPVVEETDAEDPISKSDEVKQEEPEEDSDPVKYEDGENSSPT